MNTEQLQILSEALTQYIDNSQDMDSPPANLPEAQRMRDAIDGELVRRMEGK